MGVTGQRNGGAFGNRQMLIWSGTDLETRSGLQMATQIADELVRLGFLDRTDPLQVLAIDTGYDFEGEPMVVRPPGGGHNAWMISSLGATLLDRVGGSEAWAGGGRVRRATS